MEIIKKIDKWDIPDIVKRYRRSQRNGTDLFIDIEGKIYKLVIDGSYVVLEPEGFKGEIPTSTVRFDVPEYQWGSSAFQEGVDLAQDIEFDIYYEITKIEDEENIEEEKK